MNPWLTKAIIKGIKADYVKRTITLTLEADLNDFPAPDRDKVAEWAENEFRVDVGFDRSHKPAPLLDGIAES